ncbi:E3 ubiquitin-protein ligase RHA1B-like [Lolium rigidum]|uniref:E3 ubiquitin-protein ligase RHA1B-like n=1 Tax=Lolium rigidum TaxID=89674 RepID=UPI001F5D5D3C|nr:E3 ubiquitin-protein ligase RHA1B-like [Lolium rigidum]
MGFPLVSYCVSVPKPVIAFCKLLAVIKHALLLALCRAPPGRSVTADSAPLPEDVKERLPAVEFRSLLLPQARRPDPSCRDALAAPATCIVCLERLQAADEVRRLGNCAHAFHRCCIDGWIDLGRTTCPLCRSRLLPRPPARAGLLARFW